MFIEDFELNIFFVIIRYGVNNIKTLISYKPGICLLINQVTLEYYYLVISRLRTFWCALLY